MFWKKVIEFFYSIWGSFKKELEDYLKEQIKAAKLYSLTWLDNPDKLYKKLGGSEVLVKFLKKYDRNPKDDKLDLFPWVPESVEIYVFSSVIKKIFYSAVRSLKKELEKELKRK